MKQNVQKRTEKVYKNAWTKSTKAHRFKNRRQTNPPLKTIVQYQRVQLGMIRDQFDYLADRRCLQTRCVCVVLLCIANIRYLAGLYGNFEIYCHV